MRRRAARGPAQQKQNLAQQKPSPGQQKPNPAQRNPNRAQQNPNGFPGAQSRLFNDLSPNQPLPRREAPRGGLEERLKCAANGARLTGPPFETRPRRSSRKGRRIPLTIAAISVYRKELSRSS